MITNETGFVLGFDLGGTKMLAAVFDEEFNILSRKKRKTKAAAGADAVFSRIVNTISDACKDAGITTEQLVGIGIGVPSPVDPTDGIIVNTPNLGFRKFPLREMLEKEFGVPTWVDNDVNMGTYGEYRFGGAGKFQHVVGLFPGTGIGGGLVLNGQLFRGANGCAGEIGHMIVQPNGPLCGCGQRGCIEAIASKSALAKEAASLVGRGRAPIIAEVAGTDQALIKSGVLARAYSAGDPDIQELVQYAATYLGVAMANIANALNPHAIILGGGVIEAMPEPFLTISTESMHKHAMKSNVQGIQVFAAELGDDAVICGGAKLIREELERRKEA